MPIPKQTFAILNTSGHTISGQGVTLHPGLNEGVSVAAFTKAFLGADGEPTPSAAKHLNPRGDTPPALLPVTVRAVAKLPQEYALRAVAEALPEDGRTLEALLETEDRKPVLDAIRARIQGMEAPRRLPLNVPAPALSPVSTITPKEKREMAASVSSRPEGAPSERSLRGAERGTEAALGDSATSAPSTMAEPVATLEARHMLEPVSHEPEPPLPKGILARGGPAHAPEVTGVPGHLGSGFPGAEPGISAHGATGTADAGEPKTAAPSPSPMVDASPESPAAPAAQPPSRRGRRGQG